MSIIKESINMQASIMEKAGIALTEGFKVSDILKYITNILPTILFIQGMLVAFVIYYSRSIYFKKNKNSKL